MGYISSLSFHINMLTIIKRQFIYFFNVKTNCKFTLLISRFVSIKEHRKEEDKEKRIS